MLRKSVNMLKAGGCAPTCSLSHCSYRSHKHTCVSGGRREFVYDQRPDTLVTGLTRVGAGDASKRVEVSP